MPFDYPSMAPFAVDPRFAAPPVTFNTAPPPAPEAAPTPAPNGVLADIGHGLAGGAMVDMPRMAGQALKAFGKPGSPLYEKGKEWVDAAAAREKANELYQTTGAWGAGARAVPAVLGGGAITAAAAPLGVAAAGLIGGASLGALFGASSFQDTYEKAKEAGASEDAAHAAALQSGVLQGVGQTAGGAIAGRFVAGTLGVFAKKMAAQDALTSFLSPSFAGHIAKDTAKAAILQTPLQAGIAGTQRAIEAHAGIDPEGESSWEAAKASVGPTLAMTALLAPISGAKILMDNRAKTHAAEVVQAAGDPNDTAAVNDRIRAAMLVRREIANADPDKAAQWFDQAHDAILSGEPVEMNVDFNAQGARDQRAAQAAAQAQAEAERVAEQGMPETPSNAIDVQEVPTTQGEEPHMGMPETPSTAIGVKEIKPTEINVGPADETYGMPAKPSKAMDVKFIADIMGKDTDTTERRVKLLKDEIGRAPGDVLTRIAKSDRAELPEALKKIWEEKGGETAEAPYVEKLGDLYKKITGKEIADEAPAKEPARPEPQPAAVQAAAGDAPRTEQMAKAQRNGVPSSTDRGTQEAATAVKYAERVGDYAKREAKDAAGQDILDGMSERSESPAKEAGKFWEDTYYKLPGEVQARFRKLLKEHSGGRDVPREGVADAVKNIDLPDSVEHLSGTERGFVALMKEANSRFVGVEAPASGPGEPVPFGNPGTVLPTAGPRTIGELFNGDYNALSSRQQPVRENGAVQSEAGQQARAPVAQEGGTQAQTQEGIARERKRQAAEKSALDRAEAQAKSDLQDWETKKRGPFEDGTRQLRGRLEELNADIKGGQDGQPTAEQARKRVQLLEDIAQRNATAEELNKRYSDLVGKDEQAQQRSTVDLGNTAEWHSYADPGAAKRMRRDDVLKFIHDKVQLKLASREERNALSAISEGIGNDVPRTEAARREAKLAMDSLSPADRAAFERRASAFIGAMKLANLMRSDQKEGARKTQKQLAEHMANQQTFTEQLAAVERNLADKHITAQQAYEQAKAIQARAERAQDIMDAMDRGLIGIKDKVLAAHVAGDNRASAAMEHIASTHENPLMRAVAKLYVKAGPTAIINVVEHPDFNGARYRPSTDTIEVGRGGMNPVTLLHETTHALTHAAINRAMMNMGRIAQARSRENRPPRNERQAYHDIAESVRTTPRELAEIKALGTVRDVMTNFREMADLSNPEHTKALENEHEFVAEALSNPDIQQLLGGTRNLWQRFTDGIREMVGLDARHQTEFERLLSTTPTLFGAPDRSGFEVYKSEIPRDVSTTDGMMDTIRSGWRSLANVSSHLSGKRSESGKTIPEKMRRFTTFMDMQRRLGWLVEETHAAFPAAKDVVGRVGDAISRFRDEYNFSAGDRSHFINGKGEANAVFRDQVRYKAQLGVANYKRMWDVARDARIAGVHPADKTLAEAQRRYPKITEADFNSEVAKTNRKEWQSLPPKAREAYEQIQTKMRLDFARHRAVMLHSLVHAYQMDKTAGIRETIANLDAMEHRHETPEQQERNLNSAIRATAAAVNTLHGNALGVDPKSLDAQNMTALKESMDGMFKEHGNQMGSPYVPFGRQGQYFVKMDVADKPGAWGEVRKIVEGDAGLNAHGTGGLGRFMGAEHGTNRRVYMTFKDHISHSEAVAKLQALNDRGLFHNEKGENTWLAGRKDQRDAKLTGSSPSFVRDMVKRIDKMEGIDDEHKLAMKNELQDAYWDQLPDTSPMKSAMKFESTAGNSNDVLHSLGDRMSHTADGLTRLRSQIGMADAMSELDTAMRAMREVSLPGFNEKRLELESYNHELQKKVADLRQPVDDAQFVSTWKQITATYRLGFSPAYMAMVAIQPWQITLPSIGGRYGFREAAGRMASNTALSYAILNKLRELNWAREEGNTTFNKISNISDLTLSFRDIKGKDGVTPLLDERRLDALDHVQRVGLMNFGMAGQTLRGDPNQVTGAGGVLRKISNIASVGSHFVELSNRISGALTAYDMAYADHIGKGKTVEEAHAAAKNYAVDTVRETDGDHSRTNIARGLGRKGVFGQATPLIVGFGQYDIQMSEYLIRLFQQSFMGKGGKEEAAIARKTLGGIAAATGMIAGSLGLPFVGAITGVANQIMSWAQGDDEQPPNIQNSWRQYLSSMLGEKGGEIAARGFPRLLDIDMSSRSGYQDLLPFTGFLEDRAKLGDRIKNHMFDFAGPTAGMLAGMATGADALYRGDLQTAVNDGLPAALRNAGRAALLAKYGYQTGGSNNTIPVEHSGYNVAMQAAGFNSGAKAEQSERNEAYKSDLDILQRRHQMLMDRGYRAIERGNYSELGDILKDNIDFAVKHPQFHFDLNEGLKGRAQERISAGISGGIMTGPKALPFLQPYMGQAQ